MRVSAIIAAGGRGTRLGGPAKQLRTVGGRTLLERSVAPFESSSVIDEIIIVLPPEVAEDPPPWIADLTTSAHVVAGGDRRQDSVAAGLDAVAPDMDVVVVHDAARPFCTVDLVERTVAAAGDVGAAIAALPVHDTVKTGTEFSGMRIVESTVPRERFLIAQTPQAFTVEILREAVALGRDGEAGTDEATLAERAGHRVQVVPGDPANFKVTTTADFELARTIAMGREGGPAPVRVGLGYDRHRWAAGRRLVLGGVEIPGDRGLLGHSDADAVCHAVTDAILGAANAGDIGGLFPDDDERWRDASSLDLLSRAASVVRDCGCLVENVDVVVVTDWPKIRDHATAMRQRLAQALTVRIDCIGIKGKTSEGVGPEGRGEAVVVHAIALVRRAVDGEHAT